MSKSTQVTHFRTDKFVLTCAEVITALKQKYGEDQAFSERLMAVEPQLTFPEWGDFGELTFVFVQDLAV